MKQFNLYEFYNFGYVLHPLSELKPGKPFGDYYLSLVIARIWLDKFVNHQMIPMTICTASARKIIGAIDESVSSREEEQGKLDTNKRVFVLASG